MLFPISFLCLTWAQVGYDFIPRSDCAYALVSVGMPLTLVFTRL